MRIFFIVAAAVLFADFVESGLKHHYDAYTRLTERLVGFTKEEYTDQDLLEHPNRKWQIIPFFWLAVVVIGFLWAVLR